MVQNVMVLNGIKLEFKNGSQNQKTNLSANMSA